MDADSKAVIEKLSLVIRKKMAALTSEQKPVISPIKHKEPSKEAQKAYEVQKDENIKMLKSQISELINMRSDFEIIITGVDLKN